MAVLVESIRTLIAPSQESILDVLLFLAVVLQIDREYAEELIDKTGFQPVLKEFVDRNRND